MTNTNQKHAAIYIRRAVSNPDSQSNAAQIASCHTLARRLGATVEEEFYDFGFSGANLDRPGLQRLISYVSTKSVDYVICPNEAALSRVTQDFIDTLICFAGYGTRVGLGR